MLNLSCEDTNKFANWKTQPNFLEENKKYWVKGEGKIKVVNFAYNDKPIEVKPLKEFKGNLQEFADKVFESGKTTNEINILGKLHHSIVKDLKNKGVELHSLDISITDKKIYKYNQHGKESKGAVIDKKRFSEVEKAIQKPMEIYQDVKTNALLYIYVSPYDDKVLKLLIEPNYSIKGNYINLLKSIGVIDKSNMKNKKQYLKLK